MSPACDSAVRAAEVKNESSNPENVKLETVRVRLVSSDVLMAMPRPGALVNVESSGLPVRVSEGTLSASIAFGVSSRKLLAMVMMLQSPLLTLVTAALNESSVETLPTSVEQSRGSVGAA